jgi:hypothetical protein
LALLWAGEPDAHDAPWTTLHDLSLCEPDDGDPVDECLDNLAVDAHADMTFQVNTGFNQAYISQGVSFTPQQAQLTHGATMPMGAVVGRIHWEMTLGLANGPCGAQLSADFILMNASVEIGAPVSPTPVADAGAEGVLEPLRNDVADGSPANQLPAHVEKYPEYLNALFTPDGGFPVQPLARYSGSTVIANEAWVVQLVVFYPGQLASAFAAPHPFADFVAGLGYPMVLVVQDPTAPRAPGSHGDYCALNLGMRVVLWGTSRANPCLAPGAACATDQCINEMNDDPCFLNQGDSTGPCTGEDTAGCHRYTNPGVIGTYFYRGYMQSNRDADDEDSMDNFLDTCPFISTPDYSWSTGDTMNDGDLDRLPNLCDPTPNQDTGVGNHDGDVAANGGPWLNTLDNCPLVANPGQEDSELEQPYWVAAPMGGPQADGIGNACDPDDNVADGHFHTDLVPLPKCIGAVDTDGDGYCDGYETNKGSCKQDPCGPPFTHPAADSRPEHGSLHFSFAAARAGSGDEPPDDEPEQVCNDGFDNDRDGVEDLQDSGCNPAGVPAGGPAFPACPVNGCPEDFDGDGYSDAAEVHIGTNPLGRCGVGGTPSISDNWPSDLISAGIPNSTDRVTITDVTTFIAPVRRFNTSPGAVEFNKRWDLTPGSGLFSFWINIADLTALLAGSPGSPPMFSGVRAFGGALCSSHPTFGG